MVPLNPGGIVVLVLLIIPGLHYELLREQYRPGRDDSPFVEISRVLLSGFLLSGVAFLMLGFVRLVGPDAVADPEKLLEERQYFSSHLPLMAWSTLWFLAFALTSGALLASKWPKDAELQSAMETAWVSVFTRTPQEAAAAQGVPSPLSKVEVTLKNGKVYRGTVKSYTKDVQIADRELVLEGPIRTVDEDDQVIEMNTPSWRRLVLPAAEIASILVRYEAKPSSGVEPTEASATVSRWSTPPLTRVYRHIRGVSENLYGRRHEPLLLAQLLTAEFGGLLFWGLISRVF